MGAYNINRYYVRKTKKIIYICSKLPSTEDEYGNEITNYDEAKPYSFTISPVKDESEIREFGELSNKMKIATVNLFKYKDKFKEFDLAYLDGNTPKNELVNGENANYRIYAIKEQNAILKIYFLKLV